METILAIEMETGDLAGYEPGNGKSNMNRMSNLRKNRINTFAGYTFTCPICGRRDCAWRRVLFDERKKPIRDEMYCTQTGQTLIDKAILQALLEEWGSSLPSSVWIELGEGVPEHVVPMHTEQTANLMAIIADASETSAEAVCMLRQQVDEQAKRIEKLEQRAAEAAEDIGRLAVFTSGIGNLRNTISLQADRIEKLEVALREVAPWLA